MSSRAHSIAAFEGSTSREFLAAATDLEASGERVAPGGAICAAADLCAALAASAHVHAARERVAPAGTTRTRKRADFGAAERTGLHSAGPGVAPVGTTPVNSAAIRESVWVGVRETNLDFGAGLARGHLGEASVPEGRGRSAEVSGVLRKARGDHHARVQHGTNLTLVTDGGLEDHGMLLRKCDRLPFGIAITNGIR